MKKILFILALSFFALTAKAQFYGFESQPVCWDSSGVRVQLFAVHVYIVGNVQGTFLGYMNRLGVKRAALAADLTEGFCSDFNMIDSLDNITVTSTPDTILNITCVLLTREMTNTVDASLLYPRRQLEKHTYSVGTEVVDVKYFIPQTDDLVTSPFLGISVMGCEDFILGDYVNMLYVGDTLFVAAGDTLVVDPAGGNFSTLTVVCDPDNMENVKLVIDYLPVEIDGAPVSVAGSNTSFLTPYANQYHQSWQYQKIDEFRIIAVGADCRCNYVASHEKNGF